MASEQSPAPACLGELLAAATTARPQPACGNPTGRRQGSHLGSDSDLELERRFLGTGGGGFLGGSEFGVYPPAALGFAAGATDTGHEGASGSFALDANGRLNWQAIRNNAHIGIHEMTVTGKALTQAMYGVAPRYSYFNGCSTGGRQGLMEAQRYPQDYNGIVSAAPAVNWNRVRDGLRHR